MFLKKVVLQNVRCIEHLELPFDVGGSPTRKWTLILGENGSGKSTILRALSLLVSGSEAIAELLGKPDTWIRGGQSECTIAADLITTNGQERHISLNFHRGENIRSMFERNKEAMDAIDGALSHSMRNYFTVGYGAARRLASNRSTTTTEVYANLRARNVATLFSTDAVLNPLDTWAMDLEYRRSAEGLAIVRDTLADLLPGVSLSRIDKENRELLFHTQDGELPLAQLSDGYQNMAAWCGDLLYRITETFQDYKNPLAARGLLLIDEIDLHLHPVWQRQLRQFLDIKLPHFQILATTHSPLTAQQAGENELFFLRRPTPNAAPVLEGYTGAPNNLMVHQVLLSPAFGFQTMDSQHVESLRDEYRQLNAKSSPSAAEKRRLTELREALADLPDWSTESPHDREQLALLAEIKSALTKSSSEKQKR